MLFNSDDVLILLIECFSLMAFTIILLIAFYGIFFLIRRKRKEKLTSTIHTILAKYVNHSDKKAHYLNKLEHVITRKWHRELLLQAILKMSYEFTGQYRECATEIYRHFKLRKLSHKKLYSRQWEKVVAGIIELSILKDEKAYSKILKLLDHPRFHVRREAKIAIVELEKINGLIDMKERIGIMSEWTYISILAILHRTAFKMKESQLMELKTAKNPATRKLASHLDTYSVAY